MSYSKAVVPAASACNCLPKDFGYVCGVAVGSVFVNQYLAIKVMKARKEYDVKYPRLYHSDPDHKFNCIQRAHQNFIEMQPVFLTLLVVGGLKYPKAAAVCGEIYLAGRIVYAIGYSSGNPDNRKWGGFGPLLGLLPLLGLSVRSVLEQLGYVSGRLGCCN